AGAIGCSCGSWASQGRTENFKKKAAGLEERIAPKRIIITRDLTAIDSAPGKEWLSAVYDSGNFADLERYFWARAKWSGGYPLVHDYLTTYGVFDDFRPNNDLAYQLLPEMARFVETVPDSCFHQALVLLTQLIPNDRIGHRPVGFSDCLLRLRLRAEKLSFLPNLSCAWDSFVVRQKYLKMENDPLEKYSPNQLGIGRCGPWPGLAVPLYEFTNKPLTDCRVDFGILRQIIQKLGAKPGDRRLRFSTRVEKTRYWVWQIPGCEGTAHLYRLVFLRQPNEGACELGYWDIYKQFNERATKEAISLRLLKIEFRINDLIMLPDRRGPLAGQDADGARTQCG
ncbi:MAG: hypothetical protein ACKN9W_13900, partial [Methylococcus sp.]